MQLPGCQAGLQRGVVLARCSAAPIAPRAQAVVAPVQHADQRHSASRLPVSSLNASQSIAAAMERARSSYDAGPSGQQHESSRLQAFLIDHPAGWPWKLEVPFDYFQLPDHVKGALFSAATQLCDSPPRTGGGPGPGGGPGKDPKADDFYANVGQAIRTLREEIPTLFQRDLSYDIYRDDVVFKDPKNTFCGKKNYRTIFWSLRFHGRLFFNILYVDVQRIWQAPATSAASNTVLKMRWTVHGVPRVPWKAEGVFDGVSEFKLDHHGKIYQHSVNNVIFRDPPILRIPLFANLNLTPAQTQPCPGAWFEEPVGLLQGGLNVSSSYCEDAMRISDDEQLLTVEL